MWVLLVALLSGCAVNAAPPVMSASVVEAMSAPSDAAYARATEPRPFTFPLDHGPHPEYRTEWWYYTGNLEGDDGTPYGYQLTFFRSALTPDAPKRDSGLASNQVYMAHFAISDGGEERHASFERYSRGAGGLAGATGVPTYSVWLEDWSAQELTPGVVQLQTRAEGENGPVALNLTLTETRPPVLHGKEGLHQKGAETGNASYYYSLVGLDTIGVLQMNGRTIPVTGASWMDHEFGTSALSENALGWDWFSLQLDNGAALMLYEFRTTDGKQLDFVEGTIAWPDGRQEKLTGNEFTITPMVQWASSNTGFTYPSGWQIDIPSHEIALDVAPLFADQEMDVSFVYWEGAVEATGRMGDEPLSGRGYVELTGYGQEAGRYQR
jgi:predicted secreted hydrolase